MARIRSVKPELCVSETMSRVSAVAERTFIRLWTHCDDEGRCKDNPKLLKAALFPLHDDVTPEDIDAHLWELVEHGLIVRYSVAGVALLHVPSWHEHQKPQKRQVSKLPAPDQADDVAVQSESRTATRPLPERYGPVGEGRVDVGVAVEVEGAIPAKADPVAWARERIGRLPEEAEAVMAAAIDRHGEGPVRGAMLALSTRKFAHGSDLTRAIGLVIGTKPERPPLRSVARQACPDCGDTGMVLPLDATTAVRCECNPSPTIPEAKVIG